MQRLPSSTESLQDPPATVRAENDKLMHRRYTHPADAEVSRSVQRVATRRGTAPATVALSWLLSRPGVTAPIIGTSKLAHLDATVQALDLDLSEEDVAELEESYVPHAVIGH